jgi:hypothetical protein
MGDLDLSPLHALARWTNIARPISVFVEHEGDADVCLAVKGWSATWATSALTCAFAASVPVLLTDDADVDLLLSALEAVASAERAYMGPLWLGQAVSPAAFCRLLRCERLPHRALAIHQAPEATPPYAAGWTGGLQLATRHFTELLGGGPLRLLHRLSVGACQGLHDDGVAALASSACELRHLELLGARQVGSAALSALVVGCRQLERLVLSGARGVTAAGLRLLFTVAMRLREVELRELGAAAAHRLHGDVVAMLAAGASVLGQWDVQVVRGGVVFRRALPAR